MPSTTQRLRDKFLVWDDDYQCFDDGIDKCRNIIHSYGGTIRRGRNTSMNNF